MKKKSHLKSCLAESSSKLTPAEVSSFKISVLNGRGSMAE